MASLWRRFLKALKIFTPFLLVLVPVYGYIELTRLIPLLGYGPLSVLLLIALMSVPSIIIKQLERIIDSDVT